MTFLTPGSFILEFPLLKAEVPQQKRIINKCKDGVIPTFTYFHLSDQLNILSSGQETL